MNGSNANVLPTDSQKNKAYALARELGADTEPEGEQSKIPTAASKPSARCTNQQRARIAGTPYRFRLAAARAERR